MRKENALMFIRTCLSSTKKCPTLDPHGNETSLKSHFNFNTKTKNILFEQMSHRTLITEDRMGFICTKGKGDVKVFT